jgi:GcrA cell cycle regulator
MSDKKNKHKTLLELETGDCRWPVGDPRSDNFHFCGAPQMLGRPYCITHWPLSFVPGKGRHGSSNSAANNTIAAPNPNPTAVKRAA